MPHPDATLTTQQPNQPPETRPVPPSWASVGPLITRFRLSVLPNHDGTWDVHAPAGTPAQRRVWLRDLRQAIAAVAAQCAAAAVARGEQ